MVCSPEDAKMLLRSIGQFPPFRFEFHRPRICRGHRLRRVVDDLIEDVLEDWMAAAADARTSA